MDSKRQSNGMSKHKNNYSVSIIVPARNEEGTIEKLVQQVPKLGSKTEIVFVEGHSKDGTKKEIKRVMRKYRHKNIHLLSQGQSIGKSSAVKVGFKASRLDILIILDADLSISPSDLRRFYTALTKDHNQLIIGNRLIYPLEKDSMRFLNMIANSLFGYIFSWILNQRIHDTLAGTKALFRSDYLRIKKNQRYFGDFDPFGDFDLIFGAAYLNMKIVEVPVRYRARIYGTTNIKRFSHGLLLLKMVIIAVYKFKILPWLHWTQKKRS